MLLFTKLKETKTGDVQKAKDECPIPCLDHYHRLRQVSLCFFPDRYLLFHFVLCLLDLFPTLISLPQGREQYGIQFNNNRECLA